ncbi:MAG: sulfotransferase domain-containing protein [Bacteroidota bacterium]
MSLVVPSSSPSNSWRYKLRNRVLIPVRSRTAAFRARPDLVIAGVQKGGTTPFFRFLSAHPQVMRGLVKEAHYFDRHYARGPVWYRALYPLEASRKRRERTLGCSVRVMDATPEYVFDPRAPARIARDLPEARFVIFLRDPVSRAYSNYQMMVARGYETLPFAEAMEAEAERTAGEWETMVADPTYISHPIRVFGYRLRSLYADQLERWFAHVPRERTLVLRSEEAREDPARAFRALTDFFEIEPFTPSSFAPPNARDYEPLDPGLRRELSQTFQEQTRRLGEILGA